MIKIFQIYFDDTQVEKLDPAFVSYDNSNPTRPDEYEFGVFMENFRNQNYLSAEYTGYVSWRFKEKTKTKGRVFIDFIKNNPGYDVYFINPTPLDTRWHNVWIQGDLCHPGIMGFVQKILDKLEYQIDLMSFKNNADTVLFCNYWVGNSDFWNQYIDFVTPLYNYISNDITIEEKAFLTQRAARFRNVNYFPFIFERMFSTFLVFNTGSVRYLPFNNNRGQTEPIMVST